LINACKPGLLVNHLLDLFDSAGNRLFAEIDGFTKLKFFPVLGQIRQYPPAGIAQRPDGKLCPFAGKIKRRLGGPETQSAAAGQVFPGLEQAAVLRTPVVAEPGKKIDRVPYIDLFDYRYYLPRLGAIDYLSVIFHIFRPLSVFSIDKSAKIQTKKAARCFFQQAAFLNVNKFFTANYRLPVGFYPPGHHQLLVF
jgi:hypothetical protein